MCTDHLEQVLKFRSLHSVEILHVGQHLGNFLQFASVYTRRKTSRHLLVHALGILLVVIVALTLILVVTTATATSTVASSTLVKSLLSTSSLISCVLLFLWVFIITFLVVILIILLLLELLWRRLTKLSLHISIIKLFFICLGCFVIFFSHFWARARGKPKLDVSCLLRLFWFIYYFLFVFLFRHYE